MGALFGPAGNSDSFTEMGYKGYIDIPEYVSKMGLDCFEYQCGRGVRIKDESAAELGRLAKEKGVYLSLHAPYYISLSGVDKEKRLGSIRYFLESARACKAMGTKRFVVHSGSVTKMSREDALLLAKDTLAQALSAMDEAGYGDITVCPETMGKINQLGSLEEVMELCSIDERLIPCIDFGHLNARSFGGLSELSELERVFDVMESSIGIDRMREFHCHFSKIEYTEKGGEKMHLCFDDKVFGPDFEPFLDIVARKNLSPVIICESAGTQAEDAAVMKKYYNTLK